MKSIEIHEFSLELKDKLPETYEILKASGIHVNPHVKKITLHGSRGPASTFCADSDIDLCLVTDIDTRLIPEEHLDTLLLRVLLTTLKNWHGPIQLDAAMRRMAAWAFINFRKAGKAFCRPSPGWKRYTLT